MSGGWRGLGGKLGGFWRFVLKVVNFRGGKAGKGKK